MYSADWIDYNFNSSEYPLEWTLELCVNTFNLLPEKVLRHEDLQGAPLLILANKQVRSAVASLQHQKYFKILISNSQQSDGIFLAYCWS